MKNNKGFSLIEVLVGLAIGLIALTLMVDLIANTSRENKAVLSNSQVQTSGAISSFYVERDVRMAGYGIIDSAAMGCKINGYNTAKGASFTFPMVPLSIVDGGAGSDKLTVNYSSSNPTGMVIKLTSTNNGNNANYKVDNRYGFVDGNLIVIYSPAIDFDSDGVPDCILSEINNIPGNAGNTDVVIHNSGQSYTNIYGQTVSPTYNPPSGVAGVLGVNVTYPVGTQVVNLGSAPQSLTYEADANTFFKKTDNLSGVVSEIAPDIVMFKAYYLKDTNGDGKADTVDKVNPTNATQWGQVLGVKLSIVARTKVTMEDAINSVVLFPEQTLPNGSNFTEETYSVPTADQNYRHKVYQIDVPLRNMLWRNT